MCREGLNFGDDPVDSQMEMRYRSLCSSVKRERIVVRSNEWKRFGCETRGELEDTKLWGGGRDKSARRGSVDLGVDIVKKRDECKQLT